MAARLSKIKRVIRHLGATGTGGPIGEVLSVITHQKKLTHTSVLTGPRQSRAIQAFGLPATAPKYIIGISGLAVTAGLPATTLSEAVLGWEAVAGLSPNPSIDGNFVPSKAIVFKQTGTATAEETSQITGLPYKRRQGKSYTFPFGQTTGNSYEFVQQTAIVTALVSVNASVTFQPEKLFAYF